MPLIKGGQFVDWVLGCFSGTGASSQSQGLKFKGIMTGICDEASQRGLVECYWVIGLRRLVGQNYWLYRLTLELLIVDNIAEVRLPPLSRPPVLEPYLHLQ